LHLLHRFSQAPTAPVLIAERLIERRRFEARSLRYEYVLLGREHFAHLSSDEQAIILHWITTGPDLDHLRRTAQECFGTAPKDAELDSYAQTWRRHRLACFHAALPSEWQRRYEALVADLGVPEHPDFVSPLTGGSFTPASPHSIENLQTMSVEEIVAFLHTW